MSTVLNGTTETNELVSLQTADRERAYLTATDQEPARSIFADRTRLFTHYRVTIQFRDKIMGGIPKDPKIIEGWLRSKAGVTDETEILAMTRRTLEQLGLDVPHDATIDDMIKASEQIAAVKSTNGFLRGEHGLLIPGRYVKAMLKEVCNVLYAGQKWGKLDKETHGYSYAGKGPKNYLAERVFCVEDEIYLGRDEPDGIEMVIGHVTGPQGPRSTLAYHEYCYRPQASFTVMSVNDCITPEQWAEMFELAQEEGLGAIRSQQHGRFDVIDMARVKKPARPERFTIRDDS